MPSSLGYAILALLAVKPQSGYDISRQMKPPLGFVWQAKHGQIYPELAGLAAAGLVDFENADKSAGPPRRVHSITAAGRAALAEWVGETPHPKPMNDELVIKAYALGRVPATVAVNLLRDQLEAHEQRLGALEQLADARASRRQTKTRLDAEKFGELAALRKAIGSERDYVAWCRWMLGELGRTESVKPVRSSRRKPTSRLRLTTRRKRPLAR